MRRLETFTVYYVNSSTEKQFPTKEAALAAAEKYCGNRRYTKPFGAEETYLFGPGDGTTSVMVRQDVDFELPSMTGGA